MRRSLSIILCIIISASVLFTTSEGTYGSSLISVNINTSIKIKVDNVYYDPQMPIFLYKNRTYLPLRKLGDVLNAEITWNESTKTISISKKENTFTNENTQPAKSPQKQYTGNKQIQVGVAEGFKITVDSKYYEPGLPVLIYQNRTYLPLRKMGEVLNVAIDWDSKSNTVAIVSNHFSQPVSSPTPVPMVTPDSSDMISVVKNIDKISVKGNPGSVGLINDSWAPLASGDEDSSNPSVFAAARSYGSGKIAVIGHEGILMNESINNFANMGFLINLFDWLKNKQNTKVCISTGHSEKLNSANMSSIISQLEKKGFKVSSLPGTFNRLNLKDVGILIIGNAWGDFTESELNEIRSFVANGGGLFLAGLGFSFEPYNPGKTLADYPMNRLGKDYGVLWLEPTISDEDDQYQGFPYFHTFYPGTGVSTLEQAIDHILKTTGQYKNELPTLLERDLSIRYNYLKSLQIIQSFSDAGITIDSQKQKIYEFCKELVQKYPQIFSGTVTYDYTTQPNIAWAREIVYRIWLDVMILNDSNKADFAVVSKIGGQKKDIWDKFSIYIGDNNGLDQAQLKLIDSMLTVIPDELYKIRFITVGDFLGKQPLQCSLNYSDKINIFGCKIGEQLENQFQPYIQDMNSDIYSTALAHEINHIVDYFYIEKSASLKKRKDMLIREAGSASDNYLRKFPDNFFVESPQEFFASISNQWFSSSIKTIELALDQFKAGKKQPINQALFFAKVYSKGGNNTLLYTMDTKGNIRCENAQLTRDSSGHIKTISFESKKYNFELDENGDVLSYTEE